ncbi:hypothetical protein N7454_009749 [Penicillium verhagenii]|nr:hypothetical protein N7454_009749 [Penicillium verhagenii]
MKIYTGLLMASAIGLSLGTDVSLRPRSCTYSVLSTTCYAAGSDGYRDISEAQWKFLAAEMDSATGYSGYPGFCYTAKNMECGDDDQYTCTARAKVETSTTTDLGTCALDHMYTVYENLYAACGAAGGVRVVTIGGDGDNTVDYTLFASTDTLAACDSSYLDTTITCDGSCVVSGTF